MRKAEKTDKDLTSAGVFNHFEVHADRVLLYADHMPPGEYTFHYLVRARMPGRYTLPPTKVEEMYHPEVFGTTGGRLVVIK